MRDREHLIVLGSVRGWAGHKKTHRHSPTEIGYVPHLQGAGCLGEINMVRFRIFCQTKFKHHFFFIKKYFSTPPPLGLLHICLVELQLPLSPPVKTLPLDCTSGVLLSVLIGLMSDWVSISGIWNRHIHTDTDLEEGRHWGGQVLWKVLCSMDVRRSESRKTSKEHEEKI